MALTQALSKRPLLTKSDKGRSNSSKCVGSAPLPSESEERIPVQQMEHLLPRVERLVPRSETFSAAMSVHQGAITRVGLGVSSKKG